MSSFRKPGLVPVPDIFAKHDDEYPTRREYHQRTRELEIALDHADRLLKSAEELLRMRIGDSKLEYAAQQLEAHAKYYREYRAILLLAKDIVCSVADEEVEK